MTAIEWKYIQGRAVHLVVRLDCSTSDWSSLRRLSVSGASDFSDGSFVNILAMAGGLQLYSRDKK